MFLEPKLKFHSMKFAIGEYNGQNITKGHCKVFVVMAGKSIVILVCLSDLSGRKKNCKKPDFLL